MTSLGFRDDIPITFIVNNLELNLRCLILQHQPYDNTNILYLKAVSFEPGDLVWIYFPQIQVGGCRKFFHNYSGPYILLEKTKPTTFRVAHAHNNQPLKNEVHVNRMKRFHH